MYKQKNDFLEPQQPCPVCGGQEFEWGRLSGQVSYAPGLGMWKGRGQKAIKIRRCLQCNNLLQFTDDELTKQRNMMIAVAVTIALVIGLVAVLLPILLTASRVRH